MRTIHTPGTVSPERMLTIEAPEDIAPGEHQVVVVIDDLPTGDLAAIAQNGGARTGETDQAGTTAVTTERSRGRGSGGW